MNDKLIRFRRVIVESPFRGNVDLHFAYLQDCLKDCIRRGESPYASHQMLTDCLDDDVPAEREMSIQAGLAWHGSAEACVVYTDLGISGGMKHGIHNAQWEGIPVEYRQLEEWSEDTFIFLDDGRRYCHTVVLSGCRVCSKCEQADAVALFVFEDDTHYTRCTNCLNDEHRGAYEASLKMMQRGGRGEIQ